jgi:methyl-accepting chemotaxis protein
VNKAFPLDKKLRLGFGLLLSILIGLSVISYTTITNLIETNGWVAHTHEVIAAVEKVFSDCQDMETSVRGYYIMGYEEFLTTYLDANRVYYPDIRRFKELTVDNPSQQKRAEELAAMCVEKVNVCEQVIQARRGTGYEEAAKLATIVRGRNCMQKIRAIVNEATVEENRLLTVRREVADKTTYRAKVVLPCLIFLDFILMVFGYSYITNKIAARGV